MRQVFADMHYWLALLNLRDQDHARAVAFRRRERFDVVVTTAWVLVELADGMCSRGTREVCVTAIVDLRRSRQVRIVEANETLFWRGFEHYLKRPDKEWSLTDCISFLVMAEEGLTEALTADRHFQQAGFTALLLAEG